VLNLVSKLLAIIIYPVGLTGLLILAAMAAVWCSRRKTALVLGGLAVLFLWTFSSGPVSYFLVRSLESRYLPLDSRPAVSAIVLLCGSRERLAGASALMEDGYAPRLVLSGGKTDWIQSFPGSEAGSQAGYLKAHYKMDAEKIFLEEKSQTTFENAKFTRDLFTARGWSKEIILVTSAYHMPRAVAVFQKQGFTVYPAATDYHAMQQFRFRFYHLLPQARYLTESTGAIHEFAGLLAYRFYGLSTSSVNLR
jgi:uncharacterized SAM-binding protein YcdF (DUF218 family)